MTRILLSALLVMLFAADALAVATMDGRLTDDSSFYGAALSTQNTKTGYGDATLGDPVNGGEGSEIDQVFGKVANGRLYVLVTGNLQPNFNKLAVFIDSGKPGGVHTINGAALPPGVDGFCCGGFGTTDGALQRMGGLTFDNGFNANYFLAFTNGFEVVNPNAPDEDRFWALTAHYADLSHGAGGAVVPAGMQLAYQGLPKVLRFPGDYNHNGSVDAADYTVWRDTLGASVPRGTGADSDGDGVITSADYTNWVNRFGTDTSLAGYSYMPQSPSEVPSQALLGPQLPNLTQGQMIDRAYALSSGGCTNDTGAGCVTKEMEFALNVDPNEIGTNQSSHRNFNNSIDLQMALDNSNTMGVHSTGGPFNLDANDNPQNVTTGIEFSIPLSQIGNPTGNIKLSAFITSLGYNDISNQVDGTGMYDAGAGTGANIGSAFFNPAIGTFDDVPGNQYVTITNPGAGGGAGVVPEPATLTLACLALSGLAVRQWSNRFRGVPTRG
jgi:Dockerin type I domain